jgi:hypothetical protein
LPAPRDDFYTVSMLSRAMRLLAPCILLSLGATAAAAQESACASLPRPGTDLVDAGSQRLRAAQLTGVAPLQSLTIRRPSLERKVRLCGYAADADDLPSIELLPVRVRTLYNSAYPLNVNTGPVWAGVGVSTTLEAGAELRLGPLHAAFYPVLAFQQNRSFLTRQLDGRGVSPFRYAGSPGIDWPQRHGDDAFWTVHPGQSVIRVEGWGLTAGVSTENLWIGPAQRAALMLSSSAPGFPHVFLSTARPLRSPVGSLEAQFFWGRLSESDWFDNVPENDHNLLVGTTLAWQPSFLPGLFLGAHRSFIVTWDQPEWTTPLDYIINPYLDLRGNPPGDNKLMSVFGRWVLPASEFEVYGEWAREDGWGAWVDLLREADHSQAFMLGLQKLTVAGSTTLRWWGELANLQHSLVVRGGRGTQTLYVHGELMQGYTHRGQLLGAWIGPGSRSQILGVDVHYGGRTTGAAIERVRFDSDAYYNQWARFYGETGHDASIALWLKHNQSLGRGLLFAANASIARRQNRNFVHFTGEQPPDLRWETNSHLDLELRWQPRRPAYHPTNGASSLRRVP